MDAFNNPLVGCCWDTGHGMISGDDQYEALTLLGHRVKALHIDDNYGTARDVHLLPYEGLIDWSKVLRALREIGYDHDFAFEHALQSHPARRDALSAALHVRAGQRNAVEYVIRIFPSKQPRRRT